MASLFMLFSSVWLLKNHVTSVSLFFIILTPTALKYKPPTLLQLISSFPIPSFLSPPPLLLFPFQLTLAQWAGGLLLADGLFQAADDAVFVPETLAVRRPQGFHLAPVLDAVSLQLDTVLVSLLLQLLKV